jgi:hypothetical protein
VSAGTGIVVAINERYLLGDLGVVVAPAGFSSIVAIDTETFFSSKCIP